VRTLAYYVGATLDGVIAGPDGDADFFAPDEETLGFIASEHPDTVPTHVREHLGLGPSPSRFDTVIMGRATYAPALDVGITDPYAHLRTYVASTTMPEGPDGGVEVVRDPLALVRRLKAQEGADVWLAGGGTLAAHLLPEIDEVVLKTYPIVAGTGIPLFASGGFVGDRLSVTDTRVLGNGTIVATYRR
jgi:dihydrofolate reductase